MPKDSAKPKRKAAEKAEKPPARSKKAKKEPNGQKTPRGLSAYMHYSKKNRELIKAENPDASFGEIGKLLGAKWKEISAEEKQEYIDLAAADKAKVEKEKNEAEKKRKSASADEQDEDDD